MLVAVLGETCALHVLATGRSTWSAKSGVTAALEVTGLLLVAVAVATALNKTVKTRPKQLSHPVVFYGVLFAVIAAFVLVVLQGAERL
jgi:hypothetical protein